MKSESNRDGVGQGGTEPLMVARGDTGCGQRLGEGSGHCVCVYIGSCMAPFSLHTLSTGGGCFAVVCQALVAVPGCVPQGDTGCMGTQGVRVALDRTVLLVQQAPVGF